MGLNKHDASSNTVYGLGMIGALIYFLSTSTSFLDGLWGIVQAIFWPAFLIFHALKALGI